MRRNPAWVAGLVVALGTAALIGIRYGIDVVGDSSQLAEAEQAFRHRNLKKTRVLLDPLMSRASPSAGAQALENQLDAESPAVEAIDQLDTIFDRSLREHVAPDEEKVAPLLERASTTLLFKDRLELDQRTWNGLQSLDADALTAVLEAHGRHDRAAVRARISCPPERCSDDWLEAQLDQEVQVREALDAASKLITHEGQLVDQHDLRSARALLEAHGRTIYQRDRRNDLYLKLQSEREMRGLPE